MPKFNIDHQSNHTVDAAYQKLKDFLSNEDEIRRFDPKIQIQFDDGAKCCTLKGSQFKAEMAVASSGTGSKVQVTVDLPLMLTPFKGKVTETLQRKLAKYLG